MGTAIGSHTDLPGEQEDELGVAQTCWYAFVLIPIKLVENYARFDIGFDID